MAPPEQLTVGMVLPLKNPTGQLMVIALAVASVYDVERVNPTVTTAALATAAWFGMRWDIFQVTP